MMAAKSTPFLNEVPIRRTKRSTAGINSRYNQTPSSSQKKCLLPRRSALESHQNLHHYMLMQRASPVKIAVRLEINHHSVNLQPSKV